MTGLSLQTVDRDEALADAVLGELRSKGWLA